MGTSFFYLFRTFLAILQKRFCFYLVICLILFSASFSLAQNESSSGNNQANSSADAGETVFQSAHQYIVQKNWDSAIPLFKEYIQKWPDSVRRTEAEYFLGFALLNRHQFVDPTDGVEGRQHLNYVLQKGKTAEHYCEALIFSAYSFYSLLNFVEAEPFLIQFVNEFPNDDHLQFAYYYLGVTELHLGKYALAEQYLTTCIEKYPQGQLIDNCKIHQAVAIGKLGRYTEADKMLQTLAIDPHYSKAMVAFLQRAYLKIDQKLYSEALTLLESFVSKYQNTKDSVNYIKEAYQYEAHCYIMTKNYEAAYKVVEEIEKLSDSDPNVDLLKVKILTNMERFDEANAILTRLTNSTFNYYSSDIIQYYQATVYLAQGNWDQAILLLKNLLIVQLDSSNKNNVVIKYYDKTSNSQNKLRPNDYIEACGTLILSYASRYSATKSYSDDDFLQNAIFNNIYQYANSQPDKQLMTIVLEIDEKRNAALKTPIRPTQTFSEIPIASTYGSSNYPNSGSDPGNADANRPNNAEHSVQPGDQTNITPADSSTASSNTDSTTTPKPTEQEVAQTLQRAEMLYLKNEFEKVDKLLLEQMLACDSKTFWTDYPASAPSVVLLRANALLKLEKYPEAHTCCDLLIKEAPDSVQAAYAHFYLGYYYDCLGQRDKAVEHLTKTIGSYYRTKVDDAAYYYLGLNEWERKNPDQASEYFRTVYTKYRDSSYWGHAAWALAQIEYNDKNFEDAEIIVNDALKRNPDRSIIDRLLFLKGEITMKFKDYDKAKTAFGSIVSWYPNSDFATMAKNRLDLISPPKTDQKTNDSAEDEQVKQ
ncbi:MAG: tetratricopeptide repeat protein [Planctomycetia bacterium]|nr:tetratricopeptide repeat protein [Planctomycetia bacterium]